MGRRGVAVLASIAALLAVMVAVALVFLFMSDPAPAAGPEVPSASPSTADPAPVVEAVLEPTVPFGGDCTRLLTTAQLNELLGEGWTERGGPVLPDIQHTTLGTLGGMECEWFPEESSSSETLVLSLGVIVLPAAQVPADFAAAYAEVKCDPAYDVAGCRFSRQVGDYWLMTRVYFWSDDIPAELLVNAADGVAATVGDGFDGVAADRQETWMTLPDCETLSTSMRLEEFLGTGYGNGYWEGSAQPESIMLDATGVGLNCPWVSVDGSAPGGKTFISGANVSACGSWAWESIAAMDGAVPVSVAGTVGAVTFDVGNDRVWLFATDGVNVIHLHNAAANDLIPIAERLLETLAG
ncbi:hypothetical protein [Microbacterium sp. SSM24]|uniref:hypothetical protein n=1 Tax=Microbacterium sp. SSM24 TaxID=2991714 RepID=UPI002228019A|nr:hypothetical protein [Microbacterium sp. SSM24]MCW3493953.1 hypothetical protein [Microbacterium sp. SSM24]